MEHETLKTEGPANSDLGAVNKRLLFAAYLQGKRDQIYWSTKWEDYEPIGKYRVMKQFLKWYSTVVNYEIGLTNT